MDERITYCISCTAEIDADARSCPACGADQRRGDPTPGSGMSTQPPAGWQAATPPATPAGYTVEHP